MIWKRCDCIKLCSVLEVLTTFLYYTLDAALLDSNEEEVDTMKAAVPSEGIVMLLDVCYKWSSLFACIISCYTPEYCNGGGTD